MNQLNFVILEMIFEKLSFEQLMKCNLVCHEWRLIINDLERTSYFEKHLKGLPEDRFGNVSFEIDNTNNSTTPPKEKMMKYFEENNVLNRKRINRKGFTFNLCGTRTCGMNDIERNIFGNNNNNNNNNNSSSSRSNKYIAEKSGVSFPIKARQCYNSLDISETSVGDIFLFVYERNDPYSFVQTKLLVMDALATGSISNRGKMLLIETTKKNKNDNDNDNNNNNDNDNSWRIDVNNFARKMKTSLIHLEIDNETSEKELAKHLFKIGPLASLDKQMKKERSNNYTNGNGFKKSGFTSNVKNFFKKCLSN